MRRNRACLAAIIALCACASSFAAGHAPEAVARLEPPITPIYEPASLVLEVVVDRDDPALWPGLAEHLKEAIGIFGEPELTTQPLPDNRLRVITRYTLDPLHDGDYPIGPIRLTWGDPVQEIILPGPVLTVREPTEEELAQLADMDPDATPPAPPIEVAWYVYLLGIGAAALIGLLVGWWWRTRGKEDFYAPATLAPWEAAIEALRVLKEKALPEQGLHEPYYVELSTILRTYIERRFHLHAPEQTTPEFLQAASDSGLLTEPQQAFLARFLKQSDRVKFAKLEPTLDDMRTSHQQVRAFVEETIPREQEPGATTSEEQAA